MSHTFATDPLRFYLDKSGPQSWKALGALSRAIREEALAAGLSEEHIEMIKVRVSQINGCSFCLDLHTRQALAAGMSPQRLALLPAWEETDLFTATEQAMLALAEAVTRLPRMEERHFAQIHAAAELSEEQYGSVQWIALAMNLTNRLSIMSHHPVKEREYPHE